MSLTRIHNLSISLDGFATGEPQSADAPFGHAGERLHEWMFATRFWDAGGTAGVDDAFAERHSHGIGAEIMGANKFGPPGWQDDPDWKGWWGPNPPFHTPTFVLTHRPRPSIEMQGGTTFHFLDAAPAEALETAREAADGQDVRIGGGPTVVRDFLAAGLVDHMHLVQVRSCSAAASASGTAWRPSRMPTTSRRSPRPAASPISRSRARSSRERRHRTALDVDRAYLVVASRASSRWRTAMRTSSSTRSALSAMAAAEPAPAAVMTWARGSTMLPAAQTPGTLVRPVASTMTQPSLSTSQPSSTSRDCSGRSQAARTARRGRRHTRRPSARRVAGPRRR